MEATVMAPPVCEARTGVEPDDFGFRPVPCAQDRGLRSLFDATNTRRYYCAAEGHRAGVIRRFGICPACLDYTLDAGPPHQPAAGCLSGGRTHCSCSACFD